MVNSTFLTSIFKSLTCLAFVQTAFFGLVKSQIRTLEDNWTGTSCLHTGCLQATVSNDWRKQIIWSAVEGRENETGSSIIGPHRSTTYVDAAYCYRPSSVVCRSVCLSVTLVSPAKTAAPIKLPFGLRTWVDPGNHVLDGVQIPPWEGANFWGRMGVPL